MKVDGIASNPAQIKADTAVSKANDDSFKQMLERAFNEKDEEKLRQVCRDFESIFVNMVFKQMRATIPKSELIPDNFARQTFEGMLDEELAKEASKGEGIGIGEMLYKQLSAKMKNTYKPVRHIEKSATETE